MLRLMSARGLISSRLRGASQRRCIAPTQTAPPLLLTGDEHYICQDGKSHTVYMLEDCIREYGKSGSIHADVILKESYDIDKASKQISLMGPSNSNEEQSATDEKVDLFSFDLQEINDGYKNGAGTGSMTWESSIAMSLYFTKHPEELRGDVIELGSGVGMGAILTKVAKELSREDDSVSVTCTDANDDVLEMLEKNMDQAAKSPGPFETDNVHIKKLDWFDYVGKYEYRNEEPMQYDTIIASDCAYLQSQINPLSETITKLLGKESKLHMFAPANRSVVYDLTDELRETKQLNVHIEDIQLSKNRIKTEKVTSTCDESHQGCKTSRFIHITAWYANSFDQGIDCDRKKDSMHDLD